MKRKTKVITASIFGVVVLAVVIGYFPFVNYLKGMQTVAYFQATNTAPLPPQMMLSLDPMSIDSAHDNKITLTFPKGTQIEKTPAHYTIVLNGNDDAVRKVTVKNSNTAIIWLAKSMVHGQAIIVNYISPSEAFTTTGESS